MAPVRVPKSPRSAPTSQSVSFDYYKSKGGYLLTRFHHTQHSANKQTLRARAAVGKMWSPAHRGSDWSPGYSVMLPFTSTSSLLLVFSLSLSLWLRTADPNALCAPGWSVVQTADRQVCSSEQGKMKLLISLLNIFLNECLSHTHARADSSTFHSIHSTIRKKTSSSPSMGLLCKNSMNAAWFPFQKSDVMKACCCLLISTNKRFI